MGCHVESGELETGCSSHVGVIQETGKAGEGLCLLDVNYNPHLARASVWIITVNTTST